MLQTNQEGDVVNVVPPGGYLPCHLVNSLAHNTEEQCKFIIDNDCLDDGATVDFVYLVYCQFGYEKRYAAIALIILLVIVLFLNLSAVADEFLCPSLLTVAKHLKMSDSLAGVTLLAFGNGCPDIFSSLAAASSGRPELIVGELLGAGIFCTSIVAGLIFINSEFKIARRPLLRDATFYLLAVYLVWQFSYNQEITFYGSLAFIIIYVIYLFIALIGQAFHSRLTGNYAIAEMQLKQLEEKISENEICGWKSSKQQEEYSDKQHSTTQHKIRLECSDKPIATIKSCCDTHQVIKINQLVDSKQSLEDSFNVSQIKCKNEKKIPSEWDHFMSQLSPINRIDWLESRLVIRITQLLRAPLLLVTILTVPVVDNVKQNNNWCRLLNSIHCFTVPCLIVLLTKFSSFLLLSLGDNSDQIYITNNDLNVTLNNNNNNDDDWTQRAHVVNKYSTNVVSNKQLIIETTSGDSEMLTLHDMLEYNGHMLLKALLMTPGLCLAVFVYMNTSNARPPPYHAAFAYFGFIMSVTWIYMLATEIISLLKTVGIMFSMSDTAIGLGVLAWGNSLGDIVANLTLADAGYARMALGASIGAPLLNLLLGFGLSFTLSLKPGASVRIEYSSTVSLLGITLMLILLLLMSSTLMPASGSRKPLGYLLIACYGLYFILAVLLECNLIKFG